MLFAAASKSDYAGSAACKTCHAAQYDAQSKSEHAHALARSKPEQPGEWAFGSGLQAITFVSRADKENYIELGESWFRELNTYARTPGHSNTAGIHYRIFDPAARMLRCFACHSTGPVSLTADESIVPFEAGVRCEDCHGPSAAHVANPAQFKPVNPARLSSVEINNLCGACHRMPAAAGETPDLRDPWNARHQPLTLAASRCFNESKGRLKCTTCHSPHALLERRRALYDDACAKCHASPRHKQAVAGDSCVRCHMPGVKIPPGLVFANHRIAVFTDADPLTPAPVRR
jgi:cytochrome c554/c'-like protein